MLERRNDVAYFEQTALSLRNLPGVSAAQVNPRTASILLEHGGELEELARRVTEQGILDLDVRERPETNALSEVQRRVSGLNERVKRRGGGQSNLAAIGFYGLCGAALVQLARGRISAPAIPLLFQALTLFEMARRDEREEREERAGS